MSGAIIGYHLDEEGHWIAQLVCGHNQHVRHQPPWVVRNWVTTAQGRKGMIGQLLICRKCEDSVPKDHQPKFNWYQ